MPEYSISRLGKFEECALQYKFLSVDGINRYEEGVEAFLFAVDETLCSMPRGLPRGRMHAVPRGL
jgi:hypothetical protein